MGMTVGHSNNVSDVQFERVVEKLKVIDREANGRWSAYVECVSGILVVREIARRPVRLPDGGN